MKEIYIDLSEYNKGRLLVFKKDMFCSFLEEKTSIDLAQNIKYIHFIITLKNGENFKLICEAKEVNKIFTKILTDLGIYK